MLFRSFNFNTETEARTFKENITPQVDFATLSIPIDSGRHVYSNWTAIMEKRGSHSPRLNPFLNAENPETIPDYHPDMLPKTLDILSRTVLININPDWDKQTIDRLVNAIKNAV